MKDSQKEHFRWAAHTGGLAIVKARDYEPGGEFESLSPYALWKELQDVGSNHSEKPLSAGDLLETLDTDTPGRLVITKYIGFEPAQWFVPALKTAEEVGSEQPVASPHGAFQS